MIINNLKVVTSSCFLRNNKTSHFPFLEVKMQEIIQKEQINSKELTIRMYADDYRQFENGY